LEEKMSLPIMLMLIGFSYVVFFGGYSWFRREGLSLRFAVESILITLLISGWAYFGQISVHPALFLFGLYLLTMRARLLTDVGNLFARRRQFDLAEKIYRAALRLYPDKTSFLIVQINRAAAFLQNGKTDAAIDLLKSVLDESDGYLGVKYESAAYYNLGVAYERKEMDSQSVVAFNAVLDIFPTSEYARRAEAALKRRRQRRAGNE
jgi:tetratricopeptide (TPR) repeat protein